MPAARITIWVVGFGVLMAMVLLKVSSASGSTVLDGTQPGRVHPLFIADPAVRHTFVLGIDPNRRS